jgi:hypothetical protein
MDERPGQMFIAVRDFDEYTRHDDNNKDVTHFYKRKYWRKAMIVSVMYADLFIRVQE